jgi:hypothetical protein
LACVNGATQAAAFDFQISNAATGGNLGVYFVDGSGPGGGSSIMSLDQAMAQGAVKIYQQRSASSVDPTTGRTMYVNGPVAIENLSAGSILLQVGDLVRGGLQDQVVARTIIVPPGSGRVSIDTLCVDPFRSTARVGESAEQFSAPGALFPWRLAKLSALAGNSESDAVLASARDVRQLGVWWSIDSLRFALAEKLGVPLEPTRTFSWQENEDPRVSAQLAARSSAWKNSLPLSLENPQLARAEQPYVDALQAKAERSGKIIGAVFVINGQIEGAEIYRSHELFLQMWPKLLRAYAAEAIAASGMQPAHTPSIRQVREFLTAAEQSPAKDLGFATQIRENDASVYTTTADADGAWVYRSYVAKLPADRLTPEGALVRMLETGMVAGRAIASLDDKDMIVLHGDRSSEHFIGAVAEDPSVNRTLESSARRVDRVATALVPGTTVGDRWLPTIEQEQVRRSGGSDLTAIFVALLTLAAAAFALFKLAIWSVRPAKQAALRLAAVSKWLYCAAVASLQALATWARQRRQTPQSLPAAALPALPASAVVQPISEYARRRSDAARAATIRARPVTADREPDEALAA